MDFLHNSLQLIEHYMRLFDRGIVHTVEVWYPPAPEEEETAAWQLMGGLYGLTFGAAFCGGRSRVAAS